MRIQKKHSGFTLVEMLVVITIISILAAMALPALSAARESARNSNCKSNMRNFYVGFTTFADKDPSQRFSSGAWDGKRDGCMDTIGWVADMVNSGVCKPQELLCPSSSYRGTEKYNDYLGVNTFAASEGGPAALVTNVGICKGKTFPATNAATAADGTWIADNLLAKGYGTNYMTTWFMSRTGPRLVTTYTGSGSAAQVKSVFPITDSVPATNRHKIKGLGGTLGPLSRRVVNNAWPASSTIPLLGDSNAGDQREAVTVQPIISSDGVQFIQAGERLAESFSDGPCAKVATVTGSVGKLATWGTGSADVAVIDDTVPYNIYTLEQAPAGAQITYDHLQDYRDFGPVHGSGRGGSANVLMADGSVKSFTDQNGDGFLNPGFDLSAVTTPAQAEGTGYKDSLVELPAAQIFSGVFLNKWSVKENLDQ